MNALPECCKVAPDAERAETLYCAYQRGGPDYHAGRTPDGGLCPPWAQILYLARHGDTVAAEVVAKWRAVAENVEKGMAAMAENGLIQAIAAAEPASRMFHVKQAGGRDLGALLGYLDNNGNFHADNGALYGCLYSAEPVEPPKPKSPEALPKLEAGACVARRVRVEAVIGDIIVFDDAMWVNVKAWTLDNFLPDTTEDDIPW